MSIKVTTQPKNRVTVTLQQQAQIKSVGLTGKGLGAQFLKQMQDVDTSSLDNNDTLVYDSASEKFVFKELPIVNGGTF